MRSTSAPERTAGVADRFAAGLIALAREPLPAPVAHEAKRALLNVLALAVGASRHPGVDAIVATAGELGGPPSAPVLGRGERVDAHYAAMAAGFAAHVDDFDDTHLATVIHPGAACLGVLVARAEEPVDGETALRAFALGCEAQLRAGVAISPEHYDRGWHITGTCGSIGAVVTAVLLSGPDAERLARAIRLAATMTVGHREAFGTMAKAFHPGKAASNGLLAARLAERIDAPPDTLEHARGWAAALSTRFDPEQMLGAMGERWELAQNTYKPYPCGIVAHPSIDAALALARRIDPGDIVELVSRCHPLVPELMGNPAPADGLEARFSAIHGIAAALCDRRVGLAQYETERVRREDVSAMRAKTRLVPDASMPRDAAMLSARLRDGSVVGERVGHARGSLARPLSDDELAEKAGLLIEPVLGESAAHRLRVLAMGIGHDTPLRTLFAAAVPRNAGPAQRPVSDGAHETAPDDGPSAALAAFAAADHSGAAFEAARRIAEDRVKRAELVARDAPDSDTPVVTDAPIVAAALTAARAIGSGEAIVADAVAVGREVAARLEAALALDPAWDVRTVAVGIGAAAAAAHAARLDAAQARNALGLAATQAGGLGVVAETPAVADDLLSARTADAVEAAILARHGFTAAARSLEGRRGLAALMATRLDERVITDRLGTRWISAEERSERP
jgi:2-methylcitrate dehydratase PrpD